MVKKKKRGTFVSGRARERVFFLLLLTIITDYRLFLVCLTALAPRVENSPADTDADEVEDEAEGEEGKGNIAFEDKEEERAKRTASVEAWHLLACSMMRRRVSTSAWSCPSLSGPATEGEGEGSRESRKEEEEGAPVS